jgi:hypothetical protein
MEEETPYKKNRPGFALPNQAATATYVSENEGGRWTRSGGMGWQVVGPHRGLAVVSPCWPAPPQARQHGRCLDSLFAIEPASSYEQDGPNSRAASAAWPMLHLTNQERNGTGTEFCTLHPQLFAVIRAFDRSTPNHELPAPRACGAGDTRERTGTNTDWIGPIFNRGNHASTWTPGIGNPF